MAQQECAFEGCDKLVRTRGLCGGHYQQERMGKPLKPLQKRKGYGEGPPCKFEGCLRRLWSNGWCKEHYYQDFRGEELTPLRKRHWNKGKTCYAEECENEAKAKGLCYQHASQLSKTGKLSVIIPRGQAVLPNGSNLKRDEQGRKQCGKCLEWKPEEEFPESTQTWRYLDGRHSQCRPCRSAYTKSRKVRDLCLAYNITVERYADMVEEIGGVCPGCETVPTGKRPFHIDHDHSCCDKAASSCGKCVRGLLCHRCNVALGMLRDDPATLRRLAKYVEHHKTRKEAADGQQERPDSPPLLGKDTPE